MCHFTFKEMISAHFAELNPQNFYVGVILIHLFAHLSHSVFPLKLSCRFSNYQWQNCQIFDWLSIFISFWAILVYLCSNNYGSELIGVQLSRNQILILFVLYICTDKSQFLKPFGPWVKGQTSAPCRCRLRGSSIYLQHIPDLVDID